MNPIALLLADGRWPGGGYAHSGGLEPAVASGAVASASDLAEFVTGRLTTSGVTDAWLAAEAARAAAGDDAGPALLQLQRLCEARLPSPAMRRAGRALGRGLRRTALRCWPGSIDPSIEQYPVVFGAVAGAAGLSPREAAELVVHHLVFGCLGAAPKLMAIDMTDVCEIAVRLAPLATAVVDEALASSQPPSWSSPLVEARAEDHADWEVRLFAS